MKKIIPLFTLLIILVFSSMVYAHPGRTDENGGHYDRSTGEYHYHHGYPAHQHENGVCPYDFNDNTKNDNNNQIVTHKNQNTLIHSVVFIILCNSAPFIYIAYTFFVDYVKSYKKKLSDKKSKKLLVETTLFHSYCEFNNYDHLYYTTISVIYENQYDLNLADDLVLYIFIIVLGFPFMKRHSDKHNYVCETLIDTIDSIIFLYCILILACITNTPFSRYSECKKNFIKNLSNKLRYVINTGYLLKCEKDFFNTIFNERANLYISLFYEYDSDYSVVFETYTRVIYQNNTLHKYKPFDFSNCSSVDIELNNTIYDQLNYFFDTISSTSDTVIVDIIEQLNHGIWI